jgi:4-hydroxy-tetrahydrodipicolinate reductase
VNNLKTADNKIYSIADIGIIHTAHTRKGFALDAVLAAEFLKGKKGIYGMKNVLGL